MGQGNREGHRTEIGPQTTEKKNEKHIKNNKYWRSEDWVGTDTRSFRLPAKPKTCKAQPKQKKNQKIHDKNNTKIQHSNFKSPDVRRSDRRHR